MMKQTIMVLLFFFLIFGIAGVQLLSGCLKNRCVSMATGQMLDEEGEGEGMYCGGVEECPD